MDRQEFEDRMELYAEVVEEKLEEGANKHDLITETANHAKETIHGKGFILMHHSEHSKRALERARELNSLDAEAHKIPAKLAYHVIETELRERV